MLILTRRPGESIHLGDEIVITLFGVHGLQARIGVQAPSSVQVHRDEVYARIQRELGAAGPSHIDERVKAAAAEVDPRQVFARVNPIGASSEELEMGRNGFVDQRTHADYLIFLAGYRAAMEASQ